MAQSCSPEDDFCHSLRYQKSCGCFAELLQLCSMRLAGILILLLAVLAQTFRSAEVIFSYHLNKSYITENFCVNKANPEMHCNGKCHLKKELKESEQNEEKNPVSVKQFHELLLAYDNPGTDFLKPVALVTSLSVPSFDFIYADPCKDIFHPPRFFC